MRRARELSTGLVLLACLGSARAHAETKSEALDLAWTAPPTCPSEAVLVRQVEVFLGQPLAEERAPKVTLRGRVAGSEAQGYAAELGFVTASGKHARALSHPDCARLTQAAALVIALALDPERVKAEELRQQANGPATPPTPELSGRSAEPAPTTLEAAPTPDAAPPTALPPPEPSRDRAEPPHEASSRSLEVTPSAVLLAGGGMLPAPTTGVGLSLAAGVAHFRVVALGHLWFSQAEPVGPGAPSAVRVGLMSAGARACALPFAGVWALAGCVGPELGDMSGRGEEVQRERTRHDRWSALFLGLELGHRGLGRLVPVAGVEAGLAFERPRFGVRRDGRDVSVFRPASLELQGYLGLGLLL